MGTAVAINISPTLSAEPVNRKTRIDAASEVRALPIAEINWAVHNNVKDRLRKTANGDGWSELARAATRVLLWKAVPGRFSARLTGWVPVSMRPPTQVAG
jgi:hypothetical protein